MIDIPLAALANQELSIPLDGRRYVITVKEINGGVAITIERDTVVIVQNHRLLPLNYVLPYDYVEAGMGNFILSTQNDELADWTQFGTTQFLTYVTQEEIDNANGT